MEIGYRRGESVCLGHLATISLHKGELKQAERLYNNSLSIQREMNYRRGEGLLGCLGEIARMKGDNEESERLHREALSI